MRPENIWTPVHQQRKKEGLSDLLKLKLGRFERTMMKTINRAGDHVHL